jgi:hypothetical protein
MSVFRRERVEDIWDEAWPLVMAHHATNGVKGLEFEPNRERYIAFDKADLLVMYTMRDGPLLFGYARSGVRVT